MQILHLLRANRKRAFGALTMILFLLWAGGVGKLRAQNVEKDSTEWVGEWRDTGNLQYAFTLKLKPHGDGRITGVFEWKLIWTSLYEHKPKVGAIAKEYVVGRYESAEKTFRLVGIRQDDPADIISMDSYIIHLSADGKRIEGLNVKPENYHGSLFGVKSIRKPPPVIAKAEPVIPKDPAKPVTPTAVKPIEKVVPTVAEAPPAKAPVAAPSKAVAELSKREIVTRKEIKVDDGQVRVRVFDESIIDGDVVSLSWNGVWVLRYYRIATLPKEIVLDLQQGQNILVMYAENLGKYPPNTAAISVQHGAKTELFILNSDMKKSEAIKIFKD